MTREQAFRERYEKDRVAKRDADIQKQHENEVLKVRNGLSGKPWLKTLDIKSKI